LRTRLSSRQSPSLIDDAARTLKGAATLSWQTLTLLIHIRLWQNFLHEGCFNLFSQGLKLMINFTPSSQGAAIVQAFV
jgi:hypothetical protein